MLKIIKLNFILILSKTWTSLVVKPWCISMKSWVHTLMNVCINVCNVYIHWCIMYKYDVWNMYDDGEYLQNILLKKSKNNNIIIIKSWHVFLSWHAMKILHFVTRIFFFKCWKNLKHVTWWCGMSTHIILPWDLVISMSIFKNDKLPSATYHYLKQLKNISLNMS
jgi:hypothetical protein